MAKKAKKRAARRAWSKEDDRKLRAHSKNKSPIRAVVKSMKRTAGALRQKAFSMGISLDHRGGGGTEVRKRGRGKSGIGGFTIVFS